MEKGGKMEQKTKPKLQTSLQQKKSQTTTPKLPWGKEGYDHVIKQFWDQYTQDEFLYLSSLVFSAATLTSRLLFGPTRQDSQVL